MIIYGDNKVHIFRACASYKFGYLEFIGTFTKGTDLINNFTNGNIDIYFVNRNEETGDIASYEKVWDKGENHVKPSIHKSGDNKFQITSIASKLVDKSSEIGTKLDLDYHLIGIDNMNDILISMTEIALDPSDVQNSYKNLHMSLEGILYLLEDYNSYSDDIKFGLRNYSTSKGMTYEDAINLWNKLNSQYAFISSAIPEI